jgi:hypothetical protein
MKHGRRKHIKRILTFFRVQRGFVPPYRVLCDGPFISRVVSTGNDITDILSRTLDAAVIPVVTPETLAEIKRMGKDFKSVRRAAERLRVYRVQDEHWDEWEAWAATSSGSKSQLIKKNKKPTMKGKKRVEKEGKQETQDGEGEEEEEEDVHSVNRKSELSSLEAIRVLVGKENRHFLFIATQSVSSRSYLRKVPSCGPILYMGRSGVVIVEHPSEKLKHAVEKEEEAKLHAGDGEKKRLRLERRIKTVTEKKEKGDDEEKDGEGEDKRVVKRRKTVSRPNPLSRKKKKQKPITTMEGNEERKEEEKVEVDKSNDDDGKPQKKKRIRRKKKTGKKKTTMNDEDGGGKAEA